MTKYRNMRILIFVLLIFLGLNSCSDGEKEIFPLYKISLEVYPSQNSFAATLSFNYANDTLTDTATLFINKHIKIEEFYGRHLTEWFIDSTHPTGNHSKMQVIFQPPLNPHEYVRINAYYHTKLDSLLQDTSRTTGSFTLDSSHYWYPEILPAREIFYALNIKTDKNYSVGPKAHFIDGNWQIISEDPSKNILLEFKKQNN